MKFASTLALAAMLLAGTAAEAQKKGKAEAAAGGYAYQMSKGFREKAAPAQAAIKAGDPTAEAKLVELEALAANADEKFLAANMRLDLAGQRKDQKMQEVAVNAMIASGSPAATAALPQLNFFAGQFAYQAGDYAKAARLLAASEQGGYKSDDLYIVLADSNFRTNQLATGLGYVEKGIAANKAAGKPVPESWYKRAAAGAYKANNFPEANKWMRTLVSAYPTPVNWRDALVIYRDGGKTDSATTIDIYRLMRLTGAMAGERDYSTLR